MRVAVVGLGVIGAVHCEVLRRTPGVELVAVCDCDGKKLESCSAAGYSDYVCMLEKERLDAVHICTPHYLHAGMIVAALERGINVLCEKPLCISRAELARVLEAEKRSSARLGVCLQNRYNAANVWLKERLEGQTPVVGAGMVAWHRDAAYYRSGDWRGKWATEGGGVLINQALHTLDLLCWLFGEPARVTASVSNLSLQGEIEVEDTATVVCSGGAEFTLFATNAGAAELPVGLCVRTQAELIRAESDTVVVNGEAVNLAKDTRLFGKYCYGTGHEKLIADYYGCLSRGEKFAIDGEESAKVMRLIFSAYESNGRQIDTKTGSVIE